MPIFIVHRSQRGASSLENTVMVLVFLLLAIAAYESTHWLLLRQALNHALLDTARIAATQHAHPLIIQDAFSHALQQRSAFQFNSDPAYWHIERIPLVTSDAAENSTVNVDYQALQYQQGNQQIFDANTLHLRLHYLHQPATPIVRQTLARLLRHQQGPYQSAYASGYVPIVTDIQIAMQSNAHTPDTPPSSPVYFAALATASENPSELDSDTASPLGPWQPPTGSAPLPAQPWLPPGTTTPPPVLCDTDLCCGPT